MKLLNTIGAASTTDERGSPVQGVIETWYINLAPILLEEVVQDEIFRLVSRATLVGAG
jgi:hypothetical protein